MDWSDPAARLALLESIGATAYNRRMAEHRAQSVIATVNGYGIRTVSTSYGTLYEIDGTGTAYASLSLATAKAQLLPAKE
jgi:hypothetical protein